MSPTYTASWGLSLQQELSGERRLCVLEDTGVFPRLGAPQGQGCPVWCRLQSTRNTGCQGVGKVGPKERSYKKDWPPGRGGVAFVGLREENRFFQNELELPKK